MSTSPVGSVVWTDLTVNNASEVKDFYQQVVGWKPNPVSMGDYDDFTMQLGTKFDKILIMIFISFLFNFSLLNIF